jgi:hypothetical protein
LDLIKNTKLASSSSLYLDNLHLRSIIRNDVEDEYEPEDELNRLDYAHERLLASGRWLPVTGHTFGCEFRGDQEATRFLL